MLLLAAAGMWLLVGRPAPELDDRDLSEPELPAAAPVATTSPVPAPPMHEPPPLQAPEPAKVSDDAPTAADPVASPAAEGSAHGPPGDILAGDRGPVDAYRALYGRQARDSEATTIEDAIRTAFSHAKTPDLMQSVSCHEAICKVLIRWSPERARDYLLATRWLAPGTAWPPGTPGFETRFAITTVSDTDADGTRLVELYLKRRSASAAQPASHGH